MERNYVTVALCIRVPYSRFAWSVATICRYRPTKCDSQKNSSCISWPVPAVRQDTGQLRQDTTISQSLNRLSVHRIVLTHYHRRPTLLSTNIFPQRQTSTLNCRWRLALLLLQSQHCSLHVVICESLPLPLYGRSTNNNVE